MKPPRFLLPFNLQRLPQLHTDVVVIGSGVAGLQAACAAARYGETLVLCKDTWDNSNTTQAQGGIAVVLDKADSVAAHVEDTLVAGAGLCDEPAVSLMVEEGVTRIRELVASGLALDGDTGAPQFAREGAHRIGRVVHIGGDATGRGVANFLYRRVQHEERVRILEHALAVDLLVADGYCRGVLVLDINSGNLLAVMAKAAIIATGGVQRVYREATGVEVTTGDGVAMAFRAGAVVRDMEFLQFHPTALYLAGSPRFLLSEALRGEGGVLINERGKRFMDRYHEQAELAPRDMVSRSILEEMDATQSTNVWLDVTGLGRETLRQRFPTIARFCQLYNLDIATRPIPVRPAAHYFMGGIKVDREGRALPIAGLYACGEAANTGVHGANRLASNSLLEGLVYGYRAGVAAGEFAQALARSGGPACPPIISQPREVTTRHLDVRDVLNSLQSLMWRHVGIFRSGAGLDAAAAKIEFWSEYVFTEIFKNRVGIELQNMLLNALLMTVAARRRTESRGAHYRSDFPPPVKEVWAHHIELTIDEFA